MPSVSRAVGRAGTAGGAEMRPLSLAAGRSLRIECGTASRRSPSVRRGASIACRPGQWRRRYPPRKSGQRIH
uniref:Uncharacterized protein n=1 Tax=Leersia perrieri TaxID=77586 RepID=A0A0D9WGC8_9ORYZ